MVEKILRDLLGLLCCRSSLFRNGILAEALQKQVEPFCALQHLIWSYFLVLLKVYFKACISYSKADLKT